MRKKRKDVLLEPNRKYNGVLYTSRRRNFSEEDITLSSYTSKVSRARKPAKKAGIFSTLINTLAAKFNIKYSKNTEPNKKPKSKRDNIFADVFVRTTILICVVVIGVSAIAIPTSFAKKTTSIRINDSGRVFESNTTALTVGEFLKENEITLGEDDILEANMSTPVEDDMEIVIRRAMPIIIRTQENEYSIKMIAGTVQDALDKAGIVPAPDDEVYPSVETFTRPEMIIDHIKVETKEISEYREIPYGKAEKEDKTLAKGSTEIAQYGENGELELITKQIYKNGMLISEEVISEEVIKEPIKEITAVGTYVKPAAKRKASKPSGGSSTGGGGKQPVVDGSGRYIMTVTATAYCPTCNHDGRTATGTYPQRGTIAANPKVLPYGTVIEIPGYGTGRVEDTGGFAQSNSYAIDVYVESDAECRSWGRKSVQITVH